ncbi:MAG: DUF4417 domain-containing protein [Muribaculum sp.]|nr:DUF4417 domain-containing protein [Muribaculum sp.]
MILDLFGNPIPPGEKQPGKRKLAKSQQSHYRVRIDSFYHPEVLDGIVKSKHFDMPVINRNLVIPNTTITTPFDRVMAKGCNTDSLVVFYENDNRFYSRLTHPWDYVDKLKTYAGVIGPDLSQYIDMDYATRLYHNYWNKVFTAYFQMRGVNMYPNVTWILPDSYEYCVDGLPRKSIIAINSMGVLKCHFSIGLWLKGYRYVLEKLNPLLILRYGPRIAGEYEDISTYLENEQLNIMRNGSKRK